MSKPKKRIHFNVHFELNLQKKSRRIRCGQYFCLYFYIACSKCLDCSKHHRFSFVPRSSKWFFPCIRNTVSSFMRSLTINRGKVVWWAVVDVFCIRLVDIRIGRVNCWWCALVVFFFVFISRRSKTLSLQLYNVWTFWPAAQFVDVRWMNKWIWIYQWERSPFIIIVVSF